MWVFLHIRTFLYIIFMTLKERCQFPYMDLNNYLINYVSVTITFRATPDECFHD